MRKCITGTTTSLFLGVLVVAGTLSGGDLSASTHGATQPTRSMSGMMGPGLMMPSMDPVQGRTLFASKGCVVCHSVNGVGGEDAPPLDAALMPQVMDPFEFAAKMWRGADAMIYLQREELGDQIEFSGDELANIIAFVHNPSEQKKFSEDDIPTQIKQLMMKPEHEEPEQSNEKEGGYDTDKPNK